MQSVQRECQRGRQAGIERQNCEARRNCLFSPLDEDNAPDLRKPLFVKLHPTASPFSMSESMSQVSLDITAFLPKKAALNSQLNSHRPGYCFSITE